MKDPTQSLGLQERSELFAAQTSILEESTRGSEPDQVLRVLCLEVEELLDANAKCSVLLVEDGCVHHGAAPSLPPGYIEAIDGTPLGPRAGSCGTAAYTRERVIVEDIATDPLWTDYRDVAAQHNLVACWSTPIFDGRGNVVATFAIYPPGTRSPSRHELAVLDSFSNVTELVLERARDQEQLAAEKRRLTSIVEGTGAGAWEWNPRDDTATVTENWARILGYTVEEMSPVSFERMSALSHPDDVPRVEAAIQEHFRGETEFFEVEFRMKHKSGRWLWLLDRGRVVERDDEGLPVLVAGMHLDITERKTREQALRENEQDLELTLDSIAEAVVTTDVDHRIKRMNAVAEELTGWSFERASGQPIVEVLPFLQDIPLAVDSDGGGTDNSWLIEDQTFDLEGPDDSTLKISCSARVFRADEQSGRRLVVTLRDISEQHRIQAELRRSKRVLDRTNNLGKIGGWEMDVRTREVWISEHGRRVLGRPMESEATMKSGLDHMIEGRQRVQRALERTAKEGVPYEEVYAVRTPDGKKWIRSLGRPEFEDGECVRIHGAIQDVTEQKNTERHLQRMQKLESLGRLAGGIAHDFNNILMGFFASVSFAADELEEGHPARAELDDAQDALDRARRLTGQLLTFAKGGAPVKDHVSLGKLVERVVRFDLTGSDIRPIFDIDPDLWPTEADQSQLQQVFSNLAVNAREAMEESGNLYISMENTILTAESDPKLPPGRYICARVRDEGMGVDPEHIDRLFEPYFSSKEQGRGLGLATVYSVVNQHGGHIGVESGEDGAEFIVHLPASSHEAARNKEEAPDTAEPAHHEMPEHVRVLVVDDDTAVREACRRMLESMGHSVVCVDNGSIAIERYLAARDEGEPFDLMITDLTIPGGMGGKETLARLLEDAPGARVVASTGYTDDPVMANYADYGFVGIAPKPYTAEQLEEVVRDALKGDVM